MPNQMPKQMEKFYNLSRKHFLFEIKANLPCGERPVQFVK